MSEEDYIMQLNEEQCDRIFNKISKLIDDKNYSNNQFDKLKNNYPNYTLEQKRILCKSFYNTVLEHLGEGENNDKQSE